MRIFRLQVLLCILLLSSAGWAQMSAPALVPASAANELATGYVLHLNNLYQMIDAKYENELRASKLRALQKTIITVRQVNSVSPYDPSYNMLLSMECTVLDEVIETAGWRDLVRAQIDHWDNRCDLVTPRYTFEKSEQNTNNTRSLTAYR